MQRLFVAALLGTLGYDLRDALLKSSAGALASMPSCFSGLGFYLLFFLLGGLHCLFLYNNLSYEKI
jgi:hypothetical protein